MFTQTMINDGIQHLHTAADFELSIDDLLAQLALDNYSMIPCQD
jgi:hypothetical protein